MGKKINMNTLFLYTEYHLEFLYNISQWSSQKLSKASPLWRERGSFFRTRTLIIP